MTPMRIAIGGIATECCTFSPIFSTRQDFTVLEGDALLDPEHYPFLTTSGATFIPTMRARALPGGRVERATYEAFKTTCLEWLEAALPLDGLFLDMHGAMNVEGMDDAEGDWYAAAREVIGPDCLIAASYDLHGNLTERILNSLDLLSAYRTAPHVDTVETRVRTFALLERCLREGLRPHKAWVSIPVALPGERTSTEYEPGLGLYARLPELSQAPGVLDASLLVGYVWADEPRNGASAVAFGTERAATERVAAELARAYWDARDDFAFAVPHGDIDAALDWALEQPTGGLFISDSGDNPTAGGVGDRADFLRRLLEREVSGAVLGGLADADAVEACYRVGVGAELEVNVGASLDPAGSAPLTIAGEVAHLSLAEGRERQAVLHVGGVTVVLSARRRPYHLEQDFLDLGIDPKARKLTVVKVGYLVPDLKRIAKGIYLCLSPGVVDQDIPRLPFKRVRRPLYPLDTFGWTPGSGR